MSFWTTPHGAGFRTLNFLVRRLPPVRRLQMELDAAVEYHDYYVTTIDRALGQPRGNGDIRSAHMIEIARLREVAGETPTVNQLPDLRCTCGQGYDPDCPADAHHGTANDGGQSRREAAYSAPLGSPLDSPK